MYVQEVFVHFYIASQNLYRNGQDFSYVQFQSLLFIDYLTAVCVVIHLI